jgi:Kef-type K+ transport system membrane component KefB
MPPAFLELSAVLVLATVFGIFAKVLKQPLIVAYIFSGITISIFGFFNDFDRGVLELLSNLGIAFLLFLVGIDLNLSDIKHVGKTALFTGLGQIVFTALVGFVLLGGLGFSAITSLYMAVALTFSSTVIIIKLLTEKHDLQSLYGKIAVGFLLVQDFVAIIALMFLSGFGNNQVPSAWEIGLIFAKGVVLLAFAFTASKTILKYLFGLTSSSVELLFVSAISWAFLFAAIGAKIGFSVAIGAFLAGLSIASSPYRIQISARVKPLRDFFIIIFFILLGASLAVGASNVSVTHVIVLSLFILIGNPLIVMAIMLTLGFRNRTSFLASTAVAQISEFSLILMAVGYELGHIKTEEVALVAAVGIVTITLSSYLILYGEKIFKLFEKPLSRLFPEKRRDPYVMNREGLRDHAILIGAEQMGSDILKFLKSKFKDKQQIVVVDFNPEIINSLRAGGYNAVFGDVSDPEVLEELEFSRAKLIIITDPDINDNSHLIKFAKEKNYKGPIISTSYWMHDAVKLYEIGADYVVVPEEVGGEHVARVLSEHWEDLGRIKKRRSKHFEELLSHKIF